ncbi:MAG: hybrid sensor histidine kinase/response regulator [Lentisphaeria bacterium]
MKTLRILVVDDELGMRLGVKRALRNFHVDVQVLDADVAFEVMEAEDGANARRIISETPPDLLLLDHKLPDTTGLEILDWMKELSPDLLTIMITAYASLDTAVTATKRGAYDFLAKPFTPEELKASVRKAARALLLQREAQRLAEEKRQVRFQFVSVLTHELKAPLSAVEGYLRIMRDKAVGDDPAAYDRMLDRSLARLEGMRKLILDLLDLTAIESGQRARELNTLNLKEVAEAAIETFQPQAEDRNISLHLEADDDVTIKADRKEIDIVLNNLISNAIKYNEENGNVWVKLQRDDDQRVIKVSDDGIGMTKEESDRLFDDFVRIKNEKTRKTIGSGLGLATIRKIARLYDGRADVESQPDKGSTFTVTLNSASEQ